MPKKYEVWYTSGATGFGWTQYYDRLDEFESFIDELRSDYSAAVRVWDTTLKKFIYVKKCLSYKAEVDMLFCTDRDMRTKTRKDW